MVTGGQTVKTEFLILYVWGSLPVYDRNEHCWLKPTTVFRMEK
ncbi:hypothetical protein B4113_0057 [Geobacillus sp. B4113_201601]|nr:hypothetical protein B4113_0057 [Geobacillus sp. B4113_201601]